MPRRFLPRVPVRRRAPDARAHDWDEVVLPYTAAEAQREALRCLRCKRAPCTRVCPLGTRADTYVTLAAEGRFAEAAAVVAEHDPFPAICARVCHHPCEDVCLAGKVDEPIAIRALKRFLVSGGWGDTATRGRGDTGTRGRGAEGSLSPWERGAASPCRRVPVSPRPRVAVVGSGPSGLTAARELAALGHPVTVFEALPEPGGLLRWGIPAFRLPRPVVAAAVAELEAAGVAFRTGARLGRDVTLNGLFAAGYRAVLLAIGAHRSRRLDVPGEDLPGVISGLDFLREAADGDRAAVTGPVLVIGGGDAAIDAARTARRLGSAEVTVVYRRSRAEMPARTEEVAEAEEEGIAFRFLAAPIALHGDSAGVHRAQFQTMRLEPAAGGGRPVPVPVPDAYWELPAELVVVAVGQEPDPSGLPDGLRRAARGGTLDVDPDTLATSIPGVFACGDAAGGRANVTDAAAMGRRAAQAIHRFLAEDCDATTPVFEIAAGS